MQLDEIVLPVSGLRVQWRSTDQHFRIHPAENDSAVSTPAPWRPWLGHNDMAVGASGPIPEEPDSNWWAVWGEYTGNDVQVILDDQTQPDMMVFAKLWICEWRGPVHAATVVSAGRQAEIRFPPPISRSMQVRRNRHNRSGGWSHVETPVGFHEISGRPVRADTRQR